MCRANTFTQGQPLLNVSSPDYSLLLASYLKARDVYRVADKNYARAQDLYAHNAIAERDLLQAESDRNQAQADLDATRAGHENSRHSRIRMIWKKCLPRRKFLCSRRSAAKW